MKFVILAAGRGSRVGRAGKNLHKALLPLDGRAILSHQLELAPSYADIIIAVGNRANQIKDYVRLAHPSLVARITFVDVDNWNSPTSGPGSTLLATREIVGHDDMVYVSCDTLWTRDDTMWSCPYSWVGISAVPAGTPVDQWCRFIVFNERVSLMLDKTHRVVPSSPSYAFVGLAHIAADDLRAFWGGLSHVNHAPSEARDVAGLAPLINEGILHTHHVEWTDTGTERSYRNAVARFSGYDWTKLDQATYVLPHENRVVKFMSDDAQVQHRFARGEALRPATPECITRAPNMLAYNFTHGISVYETLAHNQNDVAITNRLLQWHREHLSYGVKDVSDEAMRDAAFKFYVRKTHERVAKLAWPLSKQATDAISSINWYDIIEQCTPVIGHGDFNFGNVISDEIGLTFTGIDWREDFAGEPWIDMRYDLAKLLAGTVVHWDNARKGNFRPWHDGAVHAQRIRRYIHELFPDSTQQIEIIAALSLINSAPLHASPLDEILIARATYWLGNIL